MIKKVLNEYAMCCKNTKWKALTGCVVLVLTFLSGYGASNLFQKEKHLACKEKIIVQQEEIKKLKHDLNKTIANIRLQYRKDTTDSEMFRYRIVKEVRADCEKEIKKIKDAYKKASCSICKEKKDK